MNYAGTGMMKVITKKVQQKTRREASVERTALYGADRGILTAITSVPPAGAEFTLTALSAISVSGSSVHYNRMSMFSIQKTVISIRGFQLNSMKLKDYN